MGVGGAGQKITFPVAGDRAVLGFGGAIADRDGVTDLALAAAVGERALGAPDRLEAPQMGDQLAPQRPARLDEEREVDRLVGDVHVGVIRVLHLEPPRDLLRRPVLGELGSDDLAEHLVGRDLAELGTASDPPGALVGRRGPVSAAAAVAGDLAGDSRRRTPEPAGQVASRLAGGDAA